MALRRFPTNVVAVVRTVVRGPHPVAVATVAGVDRDAGRAMAGRSGVVKIGEPSGWSRKFSGDLGPLQNFKGAGAGKSGIIKPGFNTALPNTHGPVVSDGPVMSLLARTPPQ